MCVAQLRVTLNSNTKADPMIIAGQKAFATSFILVSSQIPDDTICYRPAEGINSDDVNQCRR
jgi:hypothetical protein